MTTLSQSTKRKLSLLQLAEELGNVSRACWSSDAGTWKRPGPGNC